MAAILPAFHVFSGCDTTSAFIRKGKKTPLTLLMKNRQLVQVISTLGNLSDIVSEEINDGLECFVCLMYGQVSSSCTNKGRSDIFQSLFSDIKQHSILSL